MSMMMMMMMTRFHETVLLSSPSSSPERRTVTAEDTGCSSRSLARRVRTAAANHVFLSH